MLLAPPSSIVVIRSIRDSMLEATVIIAMKLCLQFCIVGRPDKVIFGYFMLGASLLCGFVGVAVSRRADCRRGEDRDVFKVRRRAYFTCYFSIGDKA